MKRRTKRAGSDKGAGDGAEGVGDAARVEAK
jgi:hypothetical protein